MNCGVKSVLSIKDIKELLKRSHRITKLPVNGGHVHSRACRDSQYFRILILSLTALSAAKG